MKIIRLETNHVRLPVAAGKVSLNRVGKPTRTDAIIVTVYAEGDLKGVGITLTSLAGASIRQIIENDLAPLIVDTDIRTPEATFQKVQSATRNAGWQGLIARAYAAIDFAIWDLKSQAANMSLGMLLGGNRPVAGFFVSGMAEIGTDATTSVKAVKPLMADGAFGLVVDVASGDSQQDAERVEQIRNTLGEDAWLGIRCDGRYDLQTAMAMAHFYEDDVGIDWIEAPLPADDRHGYQRLAERMEVPLALGANFSEIAEFKNVVEMGFVRVLRPDPLRLGGLTPLLKVCRLAEAYPVNVVPTRCSEIAAHLAGALPNLPLIELVSTLSPILNNPLKPIDGKITAGDTPGIGLILKSEALESLKVA